MMKREKILFSPTVIREDHIIGGTDIPGEERPDSPPKPEVPGEYPCPCCGYLTFPVPKEEAAAFICPVCFWENDIFVPKEDAPSDANHGMTLRQGREAYQKFGAVRADFVKYVRPPLTEEIPAGRRNQHGK